MEPDKKEIPSWNGLMNANEYLEDQLSFVRGKCAAYKEMGYMMTGWLAISLVVMISIIFR